MARVDGDEPVEAVGRGLLGGRKTTSRQFLGRPDADRATACGATVDCLEAMVKRAV